MTINCLGKLIDLSSPKVMGILNVTPNSFYDGGKHSDEKGVISQVEKMLVEGATFIDIGAYSSKPSAEFVSEEEEIARLVPVLKLVLKHFPETLISVDTFRANVARVGIENGGCIINDISAGSLDDNMMKTVAKLKVPYIMMHMKGNPQTMQSLANYENITKEMLLYFSEKVALARSLEIDDLLIDPGFGFAKTKEQNFEVMNNLEMFQMLELPMLVGVSRKSMIYKTLETSADFALNGTTVLNTIALQKGANILRVHDVKEAMETIKLGLTVMKRIIVFGLLFVLFSCQKNEVVLPQANETIVANVKDFAPIYFYFKTEKKDTLIEVKESNSTSAATRLFNIDRRLPLRRVILEIKKLQANKHAESYFVYTDTVKKAAAFLPFTKVKYKLEKPDFNVV